MPGKSNRSLSIALSAFDAHSQELNAIIDTPKGSRNKFKYDEKRGLFKLGGVLPLGAVFPFDFGYIPSTEGGDGDPLDVLILMDEPAFPGCLVPGRLIGVIEANQTEAGQTSRNDRLIAVAADSRNHREINALGDLSSNSVDEIEHFFISYNEIRGKRFVVLGRYGPDRAKRVVEEGIEMFRKSHRSKPRTGNQKKVRKT